VRFYHEGIGLEIIGEFRGHEGYDGVMLGMPDRSYHLEFTQHEVKHELPTPTNEHLLVFYMPNRYERDQIAERLRKMGYEEIEPDNPYWKRGGITFADPDGYGGVLMNTAGI
jgi:catechol 2,3-dioxygenase-like lactoylglutathione lyase family enzyme